MSFESHQFKKGEGGRKLGSRNKLSEKFIRDVCSEWEAHGPEVLKVLRIENPEAFAKLALAIVPKEYEGAPPAMMIITGVVRPGEDELPPSKPLSLPAPPLPEPVAEAVVVVAHEGDDVDEW